MDAIEELFCKLLQAQGISLNENQLKLFSIYYEQLIAWNEKMNLTGITEREQVYLKHFYDSVSLSFYVPMQEVQSLADIGSGAGFPSIPLKIIYPHLQVTIVDSLNKRIQFLQYLVNELNLLNVNCIHGRAEDAARNSLFRDQFDLVTARAVARLNVLNEFCLPFVKKDGQFVSMKGSDPAVELSEAKFSMKELRAELKDVFSFVLPSDEAKRHLIVLNKLSKTPEKYPRKAGTPLKSPLI
ncbi:MAG: rRNA methyltransferase [Bacilli bacterium]|nr:rRNA methyltransferase [Bacilli bacterium]